MRSVPQCCGVEIMSRDVLLEPACFSPSHCHFVAIVSASESFLSMRTCSYNYAAHLQTFCKKKHLRQHSAILAPGIIVQNCIELWYQRYQRCCLAAISSLEILCDLGNSSNHRVSYV